MRQVWMIGAATLLFATTAPAFEGTIKLRTTAVAATDELDRRQRRQEARRRGDPGDDAGAARQERQGAGAREHGVRLGLEGPHGHADGEQGLRLRRRRPRQGDHLVRRAGGEALHRVVRDRRQGHRREDGADEEDDDRADGVDAARSAQAGRGDDEEHADAGRFGGAAADRRHHAAQQDADDQRHELDRLQGDRGRQHGHRVGDATISPTSTRRCSTSPSAWRS